jgi:hypothetical protein
METPLAVPVPANPAPRQVTNAEVQRFLNDGWLWMQMKLAPGRLANASYNRVDAYAVQNFVELLKQAKQEIFTNYQHAVELQGEAYFRSAKALMFTPATPNQPGFDPLYLTWQVEHPVVEQRRKLVKDNQFAAKPVTENDFLERSHKDDAISTAQAKADADNQKALAEIKRAIDSLVFQKPQGGYNYPLIDDTKAKLRRLVADTLKQDGSNATKVLSEIKGQIAKAHLRNERNNELWNSR